LKSTTKWIIGVSTVLFVVLVIMVMSVVSFLFSASDDEDEVSGLSGKRVALIELKEPILFSEDIVRQFKKYRDARAVSAIVFRIESPGGGVSASQEIYEEVRKTRDAGKPVVVSMGSVAASGGYYVACGADKIVANPGTLTGSIGVIFQYLEFEELMKKIGVGSSTFKSGEMKDVGSPLRKSTRKEKEFFDQLINDVYEQFVEVVVRERKLDPSRVRKYADGRVFTGRQAVAWGFVDTLGTYEDAIAIAAGLGGIEGKPRTVKERKRESFWQSMMGDAVTELSSLTAAWQHQPVLEYRLAPTR
jgi:protease-4